MKRKDLQQWGDDFRQACEDGDFNQVKKLTLDEKNKPLFEVYFKMLNEKDALFRDEGFKIACEEGHLDIVRFLSSSPELKAMGMLADIHHANEFAFRKACANGHLNVVKYLLTDAQCQEIHKDKIDIHGLNEAGLRGALHYEHIHVADYLLHSKELEDQGYDLKIKSNENHEGLDLCETLRILCESEKWKSVQWLILNDVFIYDAKKLQKLAQQFKNLGDILRTKHEKEILSKVMMNDLKVGPEKIKLKKLKKL